jgi:hypothetical protein
MRIDEAGKDDLAGTVDFDYFLTILLEPGIAESVFGLANGDDLAAQREDGSIFD